MNDKPDHSFKLLNIFVDLACKFEICVDCPLIFNVELVEKLIKFAFGPLVFNNCNLVKCLNFHLFHLYLNDCNLIKLLKLVGNVEWCMWLIVNVKLLDRRFNLLFVHLLH
jgi:hypothetical protein